ncbi:MAG TPA: 1-deoxy-D-xylulose-5-phosphate reductoisomerase [Ferrovibrio sp.]|uniref:1-deoxy-D-xylulose-5-phosphate reductoisomerase n=1 Tax=Ferrovibrio sp. TaxID=1917215 RepID=UPI002ECFB56E
MISDSDTRRVTVLGSTGSIGRSTVDLLLREPERFPVEALTAQSNVALLAEQARALDAKLAVIGDDSLLPELKARLAGSGVEAAAGAKAIVEAADRPADWVMAAIVGAAGLGPTLAAIRRGAVIALANKESLVCAGALVMREAALHGATLLPVDSEHNAIFQVFDFQAAGSVDRVILTASGGPFRTLSLGEMREVTPAQAIAHPVWSMGAKISVDSATLMNKGLELIEASFLFPVPEERLDVLIHPQSVVHSMVCYVDGSVLAQLGTPDMRTPIAVTLAWPRRMPTPAARLDLAAIAKLTFEVPDSARFPALNLARQALQTGGAAPTILNAANEVAVEAFLNGRIGFLDITRIVEQTLTRAPSGVSLNSLDAVREADNQARRYAAQLIDPAADDRVVQMQTRGRGRA